VATWQFVADMAGPSPTVLLDLNSNASSLRVGDDYNLDPSKYAKGYASSSLRHGAQPTNSVAQNRVLTIPIQVLSSSASAAGVIEALGAQIAKDNILKVQFGSSNPVFFRTFADPDYAIEVKKTLVEISRITLQLEAEPFAYGPRVEVTGSPFTVSNNPALSNGCLFDVAGVLGDVETPLLILATSTGASGTPSGLVSKWSHIGTRRRGTPANYSNVVQGEAMTTSTDTSVVADAAMSGGSKIRTTFATNANMTLRASDTFPGNGTSTVEARGEYNVYARVAKTVAGDNITCQIAYGDSAATHVFNDPVTLPAGVAGPYWVDLGKVPVPAGSDPVTLGFSGVQTKVLMAWIGWYARRISGSGSIDLDCLYFVPADDQTLIVKFPVTDTTYAIDATTDAGGAVYGLTTGLDEIISLAAPPEVVGGGGFPEAIPGQTNRIHLIRHVAPTGTVDAIGDTTTFRVYYWPRWREFTRP
jgi:hypothetical protein